MARLRFFLRSETETEQRQDTTKKILAGPVLFLYYEESLVLSNLNSELFRFHCVRPDIHTRQIRIKSAAYFYRQKCTL